MLSDERLLIVEEEFLIALDIQRVVEGAHARQTIFARTFAEAAKLTERFHEFDLAIVTPPRPQTNDEAVARKLLAAGPAIVVCVASRAELEGSCLASAVVLYKPSSDDDLLAACRDALSRRNPA